MGADSARRGVLVMDWEYAELEAIFAIVALPNFDERGFAFLDENDIAEIERLVRTLNARLQEVAADND